ncbi:MAG TPA: hypothetical protein VHM88_08240 [Candidatus Acidoferrales bacterium]|nr:hypothetical protein [Candidatus Acidoferrales bacterium]
MRRAATRRVAVVALGALCLVECGAQAKNPAQERIVWKPLERATLRIDDRPVKIWNVYGAEKKEHLILVQLGQRFLLLDTRARQIFELEPASLERKDKDLLWHEADKPAEPLPTGDWTVRDVGPARRIRAKLTAEGRALDVQVPIKPDLRQWY